MENPPSDSLRSTMEDLPNESLLVKTVRMMKETFWLENSHLRQKEIMRLWTSQNFQAELNSVLGPDAPTERVDLTLDPLQVPTPPQLTQIMSRAQSVWPQDSFSVPSPPPGLTLA